MRKLLYPCGSTPVCGSHSNSIDSGNVDNYYLMSTPPHPTQHSLQLQQDYEDTKAEMPWLQLEEENLDEVKSSPPAAVKARKPETEQPTTLVREGRREREREREREKGGREGREREGEGGGEKEIARYM